ncbi:MAG: hypothetical protein HYY18_03615 [Planctomycetes bacterium]|nr:hypothetical protein [Planctomycetota bacterium]
MPEPVDPFEEFRRKKAAQKAADEKKPAAAPALPPEVLEGRPKGFSSHRYDFGKPDDAAVEAAEKPKGFVPTHVADGVKEGAAPGPRPRGFNTGRLVKRKKA